MWVCVSIVPGCTSMASQNKYLAGRKIGSFLAKILYDHSKFLLNNHIIKTSHSLTLLGRRTYFLVWLCITCYCTQMHTLLFWLHLIYKNSQKPIINMLFHRAITRLLTGGHLVYWYMKWQLDIHPSLQTNLYRSMKRLYLERCVNWQKIVFPYFCHHFCCWLWSVDDNDETVI